MFAGHYDLLTVNSNPDTHQETPARWKTPPGTGSFLRSPRSKNVPVPFSEAGFSTEPETPQLWEKDVFEICLGNDFEHTNRYRELQLSPQGEFLDNDIDSTVRRPGFNGEEAWNSGMLVKARIDEQQKIWYGEMKIPWAAFGVRQPHVGNQLRMNMFRQDNLPAGNPTGRPRAFLAWQPPGVWNPHHPEEFGILQLDEGGK